MTKISYDERAEMLKYHVVKANSVIHVVISVVKGTTVLVKWLYSVELALQ